MRKRLQNIIREYPKLYLDEINFNDNTFELEVDLFDSQYEEHKDFQKDCIEIIQDFENIGFRCAYDLEYSDTICRIYIII